MDEGIAGAAGTAVTDAATPDLVATIARTGRAKWVTRSAWVAAALVLVVYVWVASAGRWTSWPSYGAYYQMLADAFARGRASLLVEPDPRLLALPDPYEPSANEPYRLHDATLYNGRYYLYWGPVPALLLAAVNVVGPAHVPDVVLAFAFSAGLVVFLTLLILRLWRSHFRDAPAWTVPLAVLVLGLANPLPSNLGRGSVYEASITAAQMFFVGGLYFALTALDRRRPSRGRLLLCGALLACAVGSRASMALPVAGVATLVGWRLLRGRGELGLHSLSPRERAGVRGPEQSNGSSESNTPSPRPSPEGRGRNAAFGRDLAFLAAPLVAGAVALAAYNYARFGSPFELGIRYQLAGFNSYQEFHRLTSASYVLPNLWSYLLRTPVATPVFPFIVPRSGLDAAAFPDFVRPPSFYALGEATTGIVATPFFVLAVIPAASGRWRRMRDPTGIVPWFCGVLAVAAVLAAVPALVLGVPTMRYLTDWTPSLLLLATVGFWTNARVLERRPSARRAWLAGGGLAAVFTILAGPLLAVTGALGHFAQHNPGLLKRLIEGTYFGPRPGIAQITSPAGVDRTADDEGFWVGQHGAAVDIIVRADGWYRVHMNAELGLCLRGRESAKLGFAANPTEPLARSGGVLGVFDVVDRGLGGEPVAVNLRLRLGLNRIYLFCPDPPTEPGRVGQHGCRQMIAVRGLKVSLTTEPVGLPAR